MLKDFDVFDRFITVALLPSITKTLQLEKFKKKIQNKHLKTMTFLNKFVLFVCFTTEARVSVITTEIIPC